MKFATETTPTLTAYSEWQTAYDYFNALLFGGDLPDIVFTLDNKGKNVLGYFASQKYISKDGEMKDALSINPTRIIDRGLTDVFSTLVHEMCHVWEFHFSKAKSKGYHTKIWGQKMQSIGLMPSDTGKPGGKQTGQKMHHYIIPGGMFEDVCARFIETKYGISWMDIELFASIPDDPFGLTGGDPSAPERKPKQKRPKSKNKYSCPTCGANCWGKPGLRIICGQCGVLFDMEAEEMGGSNDD